MADGIKSAFKGLIANLCQGVRQESVYLTDLNKMSGIREMTDSIHIALLQNSIWRCSCHNVKRQQTQFFSFSS
jgi:hypothetical protein